MGGRAVSVVAVGSGGGTVSEAAAPGGITVAGAAAGRRLQPAKPMNADQAKVLMDALVAQVQNLHAFVRKHFAAAFEQLMSKESLHPLQRIVWQKQIDLLKG